MRYLLEDLLLFDSNEGTLSVREGEGSAKLPYAAALVLKVLCDNSQILMTRNELMERAWTENGLRASGSNLYNTLSLIRKTVVSLGVERQIIRTQPKVGLIMDMTVTLLDDPDNARQLTTVDLPVSVVSISPEAAEQESGFLLRGQKNEANKGPPRLVQKMKVNFYLTWTIFIIIIIFVIHMTNNRPAHFLTFSPESHFKMGEFEECTLFKLNDPSNIYPGEPIPKKIEMMAKKYNIDCHKQKAYFYIDSMLNTYNTYGGISQLNMICVFGKNKDAALYCFNDFLRQRGSEYVNQ